MNLSLLLDFKVYAFDDHFYTHVLKKKSKEKGKPKQNEEMKIVTKDFLLELR